MPSPAAAQMSLGPISGALTGHIGTATGSDGTGTTLSAGAYNHSCYMLQNGIGHDEWVFKIVEAAGPVVAWGS